jgi:hypothetical protein
MNDLSGKPGSGAQTLSAARAARGEDLAAAGRGQSGAEAMTALAHQFAGLVSPLHGSFSADRAICLMNEIGPAMLAGQKRPFPAQIEPPRSYRVIADSWRGLYGSDPFSSMLPGSSIKVVRNGKIGANNSVFVGFYVRG